MIKKGLICILPSQNCVAKGVGSVSQSGAKGSEARFDISKLIFQD